MALGSQRAAFTLIELLVVIAIIAILAAIAVPNFLEAQTRAKVSRVKADMRTMATALEAYSADHNHYPTRHHRWQKSDECSEFIMHHAPFTEKVLDPDPGDTAAAVGLHVLTTPISYLTDLPHDVFNTPARNRTGRSIYYGYG
jgi:prepilin-type N-terminal cleavage/methylation domain-containing protein